MKGFSFNNRHSFNDFNIYVEKISIQPPAKKKIKVDIPFMNGSYDFSTVGSNGEIIYQPRDITISLGFLVNDKRMLHVKYSEFLTWLFDTGQNKLIFDDIPDYYFIGEVESSPKLSDFLRLGRMEMVFTCEPFKYGINEEGNAIWDTFNFETDYLQDTEFDVSGTKTVTIYNPGRLIMPVINVDNSMSITYNSNSYSLVNGDNKLYNFKFANGANKVTITGTGHIKFKFRRQML